MSSFKRIIICSLLLLLPASLYGREWTDASGRFKLEAEMVSANDELVVLRTPSHRLLAVNLKELSEADRAFVRERVSDLSKTEQLQPPDDATGPVVVEVEAPAESQTVVRQPAAVEKHVWKLTNGQSLIGQFVGFEQKPLVIARRLGKVYVGNTAQEDLTPFNQRMIPAAVGHLEGAEIKTLRELENWMRDAGSGPWTYDVNAVVLESSEHGRVAVPIFLLDKSSLVIITPAFERWEKIRLAELPEDEASRYEDIERFLTRAEITARAADEAIERRAQMLNLELYATATGVTDMWEVQLAPVNRFGLPFTAVVPGVDSLTAQNAALQRFPGYQVVGVAKASW